jgi:hypothetical protein
MNTTTEKKKRIILFENEQKQESVRAFIGEQKVKLLSIKTAYDTVRKCEPEIFPEFSFELISEILRAKSCLDWLFDNCTGNTPLYVGNRQVSREKAMGMIEFPTGSDRLVSAFKLTATELNYMQECFDIFDGEIQEKASGIQKKIDSCRRYCNEIQELCYHDLEQAAEGYNNLFKRLGKEVNIYNASELVPKGLKAKYLGADKHIFVVDPSWIVRNTDRD